jgi:hypothetical protein
MTDPLTTLSLNEKEKGRNQTLQRQTKILVDSMKSVKLLNFDANTSLWQNTGEVVSSQFMFS